MDYNEYIQSDAWKALRRQAFKHYGNSCEVCGSPGPLHVHHTTYKHYTDCDINNLMVLCEKHHVKLHYHLQNQKRYAKFTTRAETLDWLFKSYKRTLKSKSQKKLTKLSKQAKKIQSKKKRRARKRLKKTDFTPLKPPLPKPHFKEYRKNNEHVEDKAWVS